MGGHFDYEGKIKKINDLNKEVNSEDFWNRSDSNQILSLLSSLKNSVKLYENTRDLLIDISEFLKMDLSSDEIILVNDDINKVKENIEKLRMDVLLNGEFDKNNAYIEIHSGAGGTESNDWANMILRMYLRYFEKKGYKYTIISLSYGEEVGIKGATINVKGINAFGYLKGETGVHRLVRISPFDSNKRRHTSFASVLVTPEIDTKVEVAIKEEDLKIDVFRSSGAGGQSVNTTDSAVRITHLPSKIVVSCQVERSQLRNKERALEILKSKLYQLEVEKKEEELNKEKGISDSINFGSQIRSYVLEPYTLVKDYRSNYETSAALKVLDGDIMPVIESVLRIKK